MRKAIYKICLYMEKVMLKNDCREEAKGFLELAEKVMRFM